MTDPTQYGPQNAASVKALLALKPGKETVPHFERCKIYTHATTDRKPRCNCGARVWQRQRDGSWVVDPGGSEIPIPREALPVL